MEFKCDLVLSEEDAMFASGRITEYYQNFDNMADYLRKIKLERVEKMPQPLFGFSLTDDFFHDWTMHPKDMNFRVSLADHDVFHKYLEIITSHAIEASNPGRKVILMVQETTTNKIVGFIRLGSPMMNIAPRNRYFKEVLGAEAMPTFNKHAIMGMIIVPTQPFGFNYLGGKLLALICCSHEVKKIVDEKYNMNLCHFETTSLYGSTKSMSQYDGLKPFIKGQGLTDSNFAPMMNDSYFKDLEKFFVEKNNGPIVWEGASSRKMKVQAKMISIIKKSLPEERRPGFLKVIDDARVLNEKKRFYVSDLGYENVHDVITGKTETLIPKSNYERYSLDNLTDWWRKKASSRYENICADGRLRTKHEVWNENPDEIDIIR